MIKAYHELVVGEGSLFEPVITAELAEKYTIDIDSDHLADFCEYHEMPLEDLSRVGLTFTHESLDQGDDNKYYELDRTLGLFTVQATDNSAMNGTCDIWLNVPAIAKESRAGLPCGGVRGYVKGGIPVGVNVSRVLVHELNHFSEFWKRIHRERLSLSRCLGRTVIELAGEEEKVTMLTRKLFEELPDLKNLVQVSELD